MVLKEIKPQTPYFLELPLKNTSVILIFFNPKCGALALTLAMTYHSK